MTGRLEDRLRTHVEQIAGRIGERHVWRPEALRACADYVNTQWRAIGHPVHSQRFDSQGVSVENLEVELPGDDVESLIVGAHYDTVRGSPGADDNASGVAALIELARLLGDAPVAVRARKVRLVAFANEEKPFDALGEMGSARYAAAARQRGEAIRAMVSLEMLGCFSDAPGSQHYPPGLAWMYPDRGDFIALVSNWRSRRALRELAAAFRSASGFPLRRLAAPERLVPGVARSDHASFWRAGYAALMVTDTAFNRYPHYHRETDTAEKLDYGRMAAVVEGLAGALLSLRDPSS